MDSSVDYTGSSLCVYHLCLLPWRSPLSPMLDTLYVSIMTDTVADTHAVYMYHHSWLAEQTVCLAIGPHILQPDNSKNRVTAMRGNVQCASVSIPLQMIVLWSWSCTGNVCSHCSLKTMLSHPLYFGGILGQSNLLTVTMFSYKQFWGLIPVYEEQNRSFCWWQ